MPPRLAVLLCLAALLPAQAPAPLLLQLDLAGPATWRSRLGPTNLGTMLASAQAEALWRRHVEGLDAMLRRTRGEAAAFARERARLLDYGGDIHVLAWLEQAEDALHLVRWSAALIATPDGHTDLAAMADECAGWLQRLGARADTSWRDMHLRPPRLVGDRLVAVLASAEDMKAATARAEAFAPVALDPRLVLRCSFELPPCLGLLRDRPSERELMAAAFGPALQRASFELGGAGPRLCLSFGLQFGPGDRGLLAGLAPAVRGVPALDWLAPEGTSSQYAFRIDAPALWQGWLAAMAAFSEQTPAELQADLLQRNGCELGGDVLTHLGDGALLVWRSGDAADADTSLLGDFCLVVPLRDGPAFGKSAASWLQRCGVTVTADDDGVQWAEFGQLFDVRAAFGFDVLCLGIGDLGKECIDAVLDRAAAGRRYGAKAVHAAEDSGAGRIDVLRLLAADLPRALPLLRSMFGGFDVPRRDELAAELLRWQPLLRESGLDEARLRAASGPKDWQVRLLW